MKKSLIDEMQHELDNFGEGAYVSRKSRLIIHDQRYIYIFLRRCGQTEYATYSPELYYFLSSPKYCSYSYDYTKHRAMVELMPYHCSAKRYKVHLSELLFDWYKSELHIDDFVKKYPLIRKSALTVDHINSDRHNHCIWNLARMTLSQNSSKNDLVARIKYPYFLYSVITHDNKYRVCFGYRTEFQRGQAFYFQCTSVEGLISVLKSIMKIKRVGAWLRRKGTPFDVYLKDKTAFSPSEDFKTAAHYANILLSMRNEDFCNL